MGLQVRRQGGTQGLLHFQMILHSSHATFFTIIHIFLCVCYSQNRITRVLGRRDDCRCRRNCLTLCECVLVSPTVGPSCFSLSSSRCLFPPPKHSGFASLLLNNQRRCRPHSSSIPANRLPPPQDHIPIFLPVPCTLRVRSNLRGGRVYWSCWFCR